MTLKIEHHLHETSKATLQILTKRLSAKKGYPVALSPPKIPDPEIFTSSEVLLSEESSNPKAALLPSVAECAIHLELLACFSGLRQTVLQSKVLDSIFGIKEVHRTVTRDNKAVKLKDPTLSERREVKWNCFVEWSVVRFFIWRRNLPAGTWTFTEDTMPPLDVLMVLHTALLNPSLFKKEFAAGLSSNFPWTIIHSMITTTTNGEYEYNLSTPATAHWNTYSRMNASLFSELQLWNFVSTIKQPLLTFTFAGDQKYPHNAMQSIFRATERPIGRTLSAALHRQQTFIQKMDGKSWLRSPALRGTLTRAVTRYTKFLNLMKLYPGKTLVPTLDVDLAWHTHQCSHARYVSDCQELVGRFVNHDDSVGKEVLEGGWEQTRGLWRIRFGTEYRVCGCWDCEALISAVASSGEGMGKGGVDEGELKRVCDEVAYFKVVEVARRKGGLAVPGWEILNGKK